MIKYILCFIMLVGIASTSIACDATERPFVISNTLHQAIALQIWEVLPNGFPDPTFSLPIGREGETYQSSLRLTPSETSKVFIAGVVGSRIGYVIIINDESGKELFRHTFPRDELVRHKFKLTITEQSIEYSP